MTTLAAAAPPSVALMTSRVGPVTLGVELSRVLRVEEGAEAPAATAGGPGSCEGAPATLDIAGRLGLSWPGAAAPRRVLVLSLPRGQARLLVGDPVQLLRRAALAGLPALLAPALRAAGIRALFWHEGGAGLLLDPDRLWAAGEEVCLGA